LATPEEGSTLFVYGSLIEATRREKLLGRIVETAPATLRDYECGQARYFFIRERPGRSTTGQMLPNLTSRDFAILDRYEEIPALYTREKIWVETAAGQNVRCWVYMPTAGTIGDDQNRRSKS
jgi:gamma-glutamylcyclotransferase (GGCT)/AIG2-like uncharacterized protein YtfP